MLRFDVDKSGDGTGSCGSGGLVQSPRRLLVRDFDFNCVIGKAFGSLTVPALDPDAGPCRVGLST